MKNSHRFLGTSGVAAAVLLYSLGAAVFAQDEPKRPINPACADTGQINTGARSSRVKSTEVDNIPTPEEALAALVQPISQQPSAGGAAPTTTGTGGQQPPGVGHESTPRTSRRHRGRSARSGRPFRPSSPSATTSSIARADHGDSIAAQQEQRKQIYDAVMAEKSQPVAGADALKPASELSPNQALNGMRPLPESVRGIDGVSRLYYIKAKDKVLLIEPNVRTVVGQITAS